MRKMETQRDQTTYLRSQSGKWLSQGVNSHSSGPRIMFLTTMLVLQALLLNIRHAYILRQVEKTGKLGKIPRKYVL